jgi:CRISPR/Cas system-associated exonuclease Cas4 (RecB family)
VIRPSSLSIARYCQLAPALSERFPSRSEATDRGHDVDAQATAELRDGVVATDADARAIVEWVGRELGGQILQLQAPVALQDPDTGGLLTKGTADLVAHDPDWLSVCVVDFKKREQWLAGRLAAPDDNLQAHAYGLAVAIANNARHYNLCLLLFGDGEVEPMWSRRYDVEEWTPVLEEIRAIQDAQSADPKPTSGPHCLACYPRLHCPSWTLPALQGPTELEPLTKPGGSRWRTSAARSWRRRRSRT